MSSHRGEEEVAITIFVTGLIVAVVVAIVGAIATIADIGPSPLASESDVRHLGRKAREFPSLRMSLNEAAKDGKIDRSECKRLWQEMIELDHAQAVKEATETR